MLLEDELQAWISRMVVSSIIPIFVIIGAIAFGYPEFSALGESYSTFLYFGVILAIESITLLAFQPDTRTVAERFRDSIQLLVVAILWVFFVLARAQAAKAPVGQEPWTLIGVGVLAGAATILVMYSHEKKTMLLNINRKIRENNAKQDLRFKTKPSKARIKGKKIDV